MLSIAILLYEGFTALDAVGPYEVLASLENAKVTFIAENKGEIRSDTKSLGVVADASLSEVPKPDIIVIPGGATTPQAAANQTILAWLKEAHQTSLWTTSVCTGSFVLGAAGLLKGKTITTHWAAQSHVESLCQAKYSEQRFIQEGKIITAAGVSAGIDMALYLVSQVKNQETAESIQLALEYDPKPPFSQGSFSEAKQTSIDGAKHVLQERPK